MEGRRVGDWEGKGGRGGHFEKGNKGKGEQCKPGLKERK